MIQKCNHITVESEVYISLQDLEEMIRGRPKFIITVDEALNTMADLEFKKELGIDCTRFLVGILNHERAERVLWYLENRPDNWFISAIKLYRELHSCGLADAKYAVEKMMRDRGITRPSNI